MLILEIMPWVRVERIGHPKRRPICCQLHHPMWIFKVITNLEAPLVSKKDVTTSLEEKLAELSQMLLKCQQEELACRTDVRIKNLGDKSSNVPWVSVYQSACRSAPDSIEDCFQACFSKQCISGLLSCLETTKLSATFHFQPQKRICLPMSVAPPRNTYKRLTRSSWSWYHKGKFHNRPTTSRMSMASVSTIA